MEESSAPNSDYNWATIERRNKCKCYIFREGLSWLIEAHIDPHSDRKGPPIVVFFNQAPFAA
jgi:hypothetical protein